jgi:alpha-tubulin suppressor-like RCC1 family protein
MLLLPCGSCGIPETPFVCRTDAECVDGPAKGACEPTFGCSFPDASCPSGRRYADLSTEPLSNRCVPRAELLALGDGQTCAIVSGGELRCWGRPAHVASEALEGSGSRLAEMSVFRLSSVSDVTLGEEHGCAIADRNVWCWGSPDDLRLGVEDPETLGPLEVRLDSAPDGAQQIVAGRRHTCALARGVIECWGDNSEGQLGRPMSVGGLLPEPAVLLPSDVVELRAGSAHNCAQPAWGRLVCWGSNQFGQLAAPLSTPFSSEPHELLFYALDFSLGGSHSCAINTSGEVLCWGNNALGQLGRQPLPEATSDSQSSPTPLRVALDGESAWMKATQVACGWAHSCAILEGGEVACWGDNRAGQLGPDAAFVPGVSTPVAVELGARALELRAGHDHTCARTVEGRVTCWGGNGDGELGNGSTTDSPSPDPAVSESLSTPSGHL